MSGNIGIISGIMEKKMETTIVYRVILYFLDSLYIYGSRLSWVSKSSPVYKLFWRS